MHFTIDHKVMNIPPPEPDWIGLIKWIGACISGLFGFGYGVDRYFKYLKEQKVEANKLLRIEKEEFIKSVVNDSVKLAIADIHGDIQDLKTEQGGIRQEVNNIYRDMKK